MLTVRDIAGDLRLATATVSQKLKSGDIPGGSRTFGGPWRVDPPTYHAWKRGLATRRVDRDEGLLEPRSPRSAAAKKGAQTRNKNPK